MAYVLFFLAGLGFATPRRASGKFLPLLFPLVLAVGAFVRDGIDGTALLKLVVAVAVMLLGICSARCSSSEATAARRPGPASRAQHAGGGGRAVAALCAARSASVSPGHDGLARMLELTPAVGVAAPVRLPTLTLPLLRAPIADPGAAGRVRDRWQPSRA